MIRTKKSPRMDRSATPKRRRQYAKSNSGRSMAPISRGIVRLDTPAFQTMAAHIGRPGLPPGGFIVGTTGVELAAVMLAAALRGRRRGRG